MQAQDPVPGKARLFRLTRYQLDLTQRLLQFRVEVYSHNGELGLMMSHAAALASLHASPMLEQISAEGLQMTLRSGVRAPEVFARVAGMMAISVRQAVDTLSKDAAAAALVAKGRALADEVDLEVQHVLAQIAAGDGHAPV
jgi:hypothetical protein